MKKVERLSLGLMAAWTEFEILKDAFKANPQALQRIEESMDYIADAQNYLIDLLRDNTDNE